MLANIRVHARRILVALHEDRRGADSMDSGGAADPGRRGNENSVSWTDAKRLKRNHDRARAIACCYAVRSPDEPRELGLDAGDKTRVRRWRSGDRPSARN